MGRDEETEVVDERWRLDIFFIRSWKLDFGRSMFDVHLLRL
jgi:hypothetical protein